MPYSHHSHSGQFCGHATNTLQEMVDEAVRQKMSVFVMTEHMPRDREEDLYPGETETPSDLYSLFGRFHAEARRLQEQASGPTTLVVGMETEWIYAKSKNLIEKVLADHQLDLIIGSVHHVHGIPIDFSPELYLRAVDLAARSGRPEASSESPEMMLFEDYFDAQFEMLQTVQPPIVGHFDLIRLFSSQPNAGFENNPRIWPKILRNLRYIADYRGLLEINSSALRKGLTEPYPQGAIVQTFSSMDGRFVLSDDSHAVGQVGLNYKRAVQYLDECGVAQLSYVARNGTTRDQRFPGIDFCEIPLKALWKHSYWTAAESTPEK